MSKQPIGWCKLVFKNFLLRIFSEISLFLINRKSALIKIRSTGFS